MKAYIYFFKAFLQIISLSARKISECISILSERFSILKASPCLSVCFMAGFFTIFPFFAQARENSLVLPISRGKSVLFTEINTGYYYTESNYTDFNKSQTLRQALGLADSSSPPFFHYMNTDFSLGYAFSDWFEIEAFSSGFWFAQSGNGQNLRLSGPQIKRAGLAFRSQQNIINFFGFIPEFSFSMPFFSINQQTEKPIIDDGSIHATPALWLYGVIGEALYPFIYGGFKWRSQPLSSLLQWKAGVMLTGELAELGLYTYGFWSVIPDRSSEDPAHLLKRVNASSLRFFSKNPGLIGFMGWIAWHFPYVSLRISGDFDINGVRYSKGYSFLVSLIIQLSSTEEKVKEIFTEKVDFEPQITEDEQSVQSLFENTEEDMRIEESAEKALQEAEQTEEDRAE